MCGRDSLTWMCGWRWPNFPLSVIPLCLPKLNPSLRFTLVDIVRASFFTSSLMQPSISRVQERKRAKPFSNSQVDGGGGNKPNTTTWNCSRTTLTFQQHGSSLQLRFWLKSDFSNFSHLRLQNRQHGQMEHNASICPSNNNKKVLSPTCNHPTNQYHRSLSQQNPTHF